ncbi:hypothetical protein THAOC_28730, partial [Thalassiosira oceanica]
CGLLPRGGPSGVSAAHGRSRPLTAFVQDANCPRFLPPTPLPKYRVRTLVPPVGGGTTQPAIPCITVLCRVPQVTHPPRRQPSGVTYPRSDWLVSRHHPSAGEKFRPALPTSPPSPLDVPGDEPPPSSSPGYSWPSLLSRNSSSLLCLMFLAAAEGGAPLPALKEN